MTSQKVGVNQHTHIDIAKERGVSDFSTSRHHTEREGVFVCVCILFIYLSLYKPSGGAAAAALCRKIFTKNSQLTLETIFCVCVCVRARNICSLLLVVFIQKRIDDFHAVLSLLFFFIYFYLLCPQPEKQKHQWDSGVCPTPTYRTRTR